MWAPPQSAGVIATLPHGVQYIIHRFVANWNRSRWQPSQYKYVHAYCWENNTKIATIFHNKLQNMEHYIATESNMIWHLNWLHTNSNSAYLMRQDSDGIPLQSCLFLNLPQSLSLFPYYYPYWSGWDLKLMRRVTSYLTTSLATSR